MKKTTTNEMMLRALLKDLHPIQAGLLRERLQTISAITRAAIKKKPSDFDNPIISHRVFLGLCNLIDKHLGKRD